jgi:hypothetical protein
MRAERAGKGGGAFFPVFRRTLPKAAGTPAGNCTASDPGLAKFVFVAVFFNLHSNLMPW